MPSTSSKRSSRRSSSRRNSRDREHELRASGSKEPYTPRMLRSDLRTNAARHITPPQDHRAQRRDAQRSDEEFIQQRRADEKRKLDWSYKGNDIEDVVSNTSSRLDVLANKEINPHAHIDSSEDVSSDERTHRRINDLARAGGNVPNPPGPAEDTLRKLIMGPKDQNYESHLANRHHHRHDNMSSQEYAKRSWGNMSPKRPPPVPIPKNPEEPEEQPEEPVKKRGSFFDGLKRRGRSMDAQNSNSNNDNNDADRRSKSPIRRLATGVINSPRKLLNGATWVKNQIVTGNGTYKVIQ